MRVNGSNLDYSYKMMGEEFGAVEFIRHSAGLVLFFFIYMNEYKVKKRFIFFSEMKNKFSFDRIWFIWSGMFFFGLVLFDFWNQFCVMLMKLKRIDDT